MYKESNKQLAYYRCVLSAIVIGRIWFGLVWFGPSIAASDFIVSHTVTCSVKLAPSFHGPCLLASEKKQDFILGDLFCEPNVFIQYHNC
jgi:hypothetical protein